MPRQTPKKRVRTTRKTTEKPTVGQLVPQPHGGALRHGGPNKGGTGRPPDAIRAAMREKLDVALPKLWLDYEAGAIDALGFANFLAKYGLGAKELVIASTEAASFFDCVYRATVEIVGEAHAVAIKARAVELMDASA